MSCLVPFHLTCDRRGLMHAPFHIFSIWTTRQHCEIFTTTPHKKPGFRVRRLRKHMRQKAKDAFSEWEQLNSPTHKKSCKVLHAIHKESEILHGRKEDAQLERKSTESDVLGDDLNEGKTVERGWAYIKIWIRRVLEVRPQTERKNMDRDEMPHSSWATAYAGLGQCRKGDSAII